MCTCIKFIFYLSAVRWMCCWFLCVYRCFFKKKIRQNSAIREWGFIHLPEVCFPCCLHILFHKMVHLVFWAERFGFGLIHIRDHIHIVWSIHPSIHSPQLPVWSYSFPPPLLLAGVCVCPFFGGGVGDNNNRVHQFWTAAIKIRDITIFFSERNQNGKPYQNR